MLQFIPAILKGSDVIEFPRPILVCRVHDSWDFLKLKIPRQDGELLAGSSRDGVDITIEGQVGSHTGELKLSEELMLETLETLRAALHSSEDSGYSLALYQSGSDEYRYFRRCLTSRFDFDLSSQRIYSYAVSIHAADPMLHDGLPPAP